MLTRIGTVACNQVFPSSFCNQNSTENHSKVESFVILQKYSDADCLIGSGQHVPFDWTKMLEGWEVEFSKFLQGNTIEYGRSEFRLDLERDEISLNQIADSGLEITLIILESAAHLSEEGGHII